MDSVRLLTLTHDFLKKRSIALLVWENDPEKKIAVPVAFGCGVNEVRAEAERAVRALASELSAIRITPN